MNKIKVKRKVDDKETELEIDESELQDGDVKVTPTGAVEPEKTFKQSEVNTLMAKERKTYEAKIKAIQDEYLTFKTSIEEKQNKAEEAAKEKVEKLREGLPEGITTLLDKLTFTEQLEWLSDPANSTLEKKTLNPLPPARGDERHGPSLGTIV